VSIINGYLTAGEASDYVGRQFADSSGILNDVVTVASRSIDRHCGRHFYRVGTTGTPVARVFDSDDGFTVELGGYNDLVSVSTLKSDDVGSGVFGTTWSAGTYQLLPAGAAARAPQAEPFTSIMLLAGNTFPTTVPSGRRGLVEVTGVWGWPAVPIEVTQACRILVAELAKLQDAPLGMLGSAEFGMSRIPPQKQRHVRDLLGPLVHPGHVGIG
jgi:hypothetical protein